MYAPRGLKLQTMPTSLTEIGRAHVRCTCGVQYTVEPICPSIDNGYFHAYYSSAIDFCELCGRNINPENVTTPGLAALNPERRN